MHDRLQRLLVAAERLTVDLVAQEPVTVRPSNDTPAYARHVADRENFDVLPFAESDGRIVRYVRRTALSCHRSDTSWEGVAFDEIHPDDIVSASSPMLELLGRFSRERPRLFVLGRRRIDAIVTVYDLNQPAAHQFGFALSLVVEAELARAIEETVRRRSTGSKSKSMSGSVKRSFSFSRGMSTSERGSAQMRGGRKSSRASRFG